MIDKIQKRNGKLVDFDSMKILNAISRASKAVDGEPMNQEDLFYLTQKVCRRLDPEAVITVEDVQDLVEETLIQFG